MPTVIINGQEIELAEEELRRPGAVSKLRGWTLAVQQYANYLDALYVRLVAGEPASIAWENGDQLVVSTGDGLLIVSHPRPSRQVILQQAIITDYCAVADCPRFTGSPDEAGSAPIPLSRGSVRPDWQFTANGPLCHYRGVALRFSDQRRVSEFRALCQQVHEELADLAHELSWQERQGVFIDWRRLAIEAVPGSPEHAVLLNTVGDTTLLVLPMVYGSTGLWRAVQPWLRARVQGESVEVSISAADMGWE